MSSADVTFSSHDKVVSLSGTVTSPSGTNSRPAIVIVVGSGPIDRNGSAQSMHLQVYSKLAEFFTNDLEWVCLRYDKRGVAKSVNGDSKLYHKSGMSDLALDAVEATKFLLGQPRVDSTKLILAGHSEGALLLPLVADHLRDQGVVTPLGLLLLSGFGESIETAIRFQSNFLWDEIANGRTVKAWVLRRLVSSKKLQDKIDQLKDKVNNTQADVISELCGLVKLEAKWYREHFAYDLPRIQELSAKVTSHVMVTTGAKDVQCRSKFCNQEDATAAFTRAATVTSCVPSQMSHLLRPVAGTPSMLTLLRDYQQSAGDPLDAEFTKAVMDWATSILQSKA